MGSESFKHFEIQERTKLEIKNPTVWSKAFEIEDEENTVTRNQKKVVNSEKGIKQSLKNFKQNLQVYIKDSYWTSRHDRSHFTEEKMADDEKKKD